MCVEVRTPILQTLYFSTKPLHKGFWTLFWSVRCETNMIAIYRFYQKSTLFLSYWFHNGKSFRKSIRRDCGIEKYRFLVIFDPKKWDFTVVNPIWTVFGPSKRGQKSRFFDLSGNFKNRADPCRYGTLGQNLRSLCRNRRNPGKCPFWGHF